MKQTLIDLFTSKKFLTAATAVIVYVAGRFGFDVDTATLDRIYAALLAYVGAQGLADIGKGAAQVRAAAPANDNASATPSSLGGAAGLLLVLGLAGSVALAPGCSTARARATAGVGALIDCEAPNLQAGVAELVPLATQAVLAAVSGDGRHVDTTAILAAARGLKSDLGRCALATAIAVLAEPPKPNPSAPLAAGLEVDGGELRAAFERVRPELGGASFRTRAGVL